MKNLLTLHEAMVIAIINLDKENYQASFEDIANYIERKNLFPEREGNIPLSKQIELRALQSRGNYRYLFQQINNSTIRLNLKPKSSFK
ncbi:MAG TPA: hypothetical protein VKY36_00865 [Moheibacter sp.]|nr:hypothetical protein [Moheibacter sp.]